MLYFVGICQYVQAMMWMASQCVASSCALVTVLLQWWHMSVMASAITGTRLFVQQFVQAKNKSSSPAFLALRWANRPVAGGLPVDSNTKGQSCKPWRPHPMWNRNAAIYSMNMTTAANSNDSSVECLCWFTVLKHARMWYQAGDLMAFTCMFL